MLRLRPEQLPRFIAPMLAASGAAFDEERWALEVKWDGIRAQVAYDGRRLCLRSRPGRDCTGEFPELRVLAEELPARQRILDGELVCRDSAGRPDFAALRRRLGHDMSGAARLAAGRSPAQLMVFDVLHLDGWAVRTLPYARRRELLAELKRGRSSAWAIPTHFVGQNGSVLRLTAQMELEGVVAKRLDSPYWEGRRTPAWIKRKHRRRERMVVTGWRERRGSLPEFLLARRGSDGRLRPVGTASLGLDPGRRGALLEALRAREIPRRSRGHSLRLATPRSRSS